MFLSSGPFFSLVGAARDQHNRSMVASQAGNAAWLRNEALDDSMRTKAQAPESWGHKIVSTTQVRIHEALSTWKEAPNLLNLHVGAHTNSQCTVTCFQDWQSATFTVSNEAPNHLRTPPHVQTSMPSSPSTASGTCTLLVLHFSGAAPNNSRHLQTFIIFPGNPKS